MIGEFPDVELTIPGKSFDNHFVTLTVDQSRIGGRKLVEDFFILEDPRNK